MDCPLFGGRRGQRVGGDKMNKEQAQKEFYRLCCEYYALTVVTNKDQEKRDRIIAARNEIYRTWGEQVLHWPRPKFAG
jgi:hypothetical protein